MKISQKKYCFFCYESVVEDKNLTKSVKRQYFKLEAFFVKESNMENIADLYRILKMADGEIFLMCVYAIWR